MKNMKFAAMLSMTYLLGQPISSQATEFNAIQADKSTLSFTFKQMNVGMEGRFKKFTAQLNFDSANAASAKVSLDIDLTSIDTGTMEGNSAVADKQWFNTKEFPSARFASSGIKALGGNSYEVAGQLSIKGHTQTIICPATVSIHGNNATFDGSFVIKRSDFSIGEGPWADVSIVANEVQIKYHVLASNGK